MHSDGGYHLVALRVNHADVAGIGVDDVNLIFPAVGRHTCGIQPHRDRFYDIEARQRPRRQVNHADRVAFTIGDVSVFPVKRSVIRQGSRPQIPPQQPTCNPKEDSE